MSSIPAMTSDHTPSLPNASGERGGFRHRSLSRSALDRAYLYRNNPELFDELWRDEATRVIVVHNGQTLVYGDRLRYFSPADVGTGLLRIFLGVTLPDDADFDKPTAIVGVALSDDDAARLEPVAESWRALRDLATELSDRDIGALTELVAVSNWHRTHQFSPRTGTPTIPEQGGWVRRDPADNSEHFPRTDPAVIMAVIHPVGDDGEERILLAHNALFPSNRYSTLAGFVEPGESLESAVIREVFEETGVVVTDPRYLGSQPWPFPSSLMLGFFASAESTEIAIDGVEILDARWFTRGELFAAAASGEIELPGAASIAHQLIETWLGRPLP
ncbi:NAD(+) diphosphatase [Saxibacter everestensis]|uniref:NAD(+) diphosphatase n=1 Tax=Saxibacter everestensis TaxID=2909229 RepID=A0ABY8QNJ0_9MICO|nr:NAD(+) diphosphatase [Brevibacteriaceae bacterium ZFBP1038]